MGQEHSAAVSAWGLLDLIQRYNSNPNETIEDFYRDALAWADTVRKSAKHDKRAAQRKEPKERVA